MSHSSASFSIQHDRAGYRPALPKSLPVVAGLGLPGKPKAMDESQSKI